MGELIVCGTPIGNLKDISDRTREALMNADVIAAEDTRHTINLLNHIGVKKPLISYHQHNESQRGMQLLQRALEGQRIALVSDAGMPCISDPGEELVKLFIKNSIPITVIPGPNAALLGLILSGFDMERFIFEGFLPREGKPRRERIISYINETRTIILYEAPHRLIATLSDLRIALGENRQIALCRELTKLHEEVVRLSLDETAAYMENHPPRGEYVVVLAGAQPVASLTVEDIDGSIREGLAAGVELKTLSRTLAQSHGVPRNQVYQRALEIKQEMTE